MKRTIFAAITLLLAKKKTLPFGDVSRGCPVGLEPTTFRTTI